MDVHVMPVNDERPHDESTACPCRPRREDYGVNVVVIHNAWDGREITERAVDAAMVAVN